MAIVAKCCLSVGRRAYSPQMDTIGATVIPPLFAKPPSYPVSRPSSMASRIVQNENGASDFDALSSAMRWHPNNIILYAFDLMHLNGKDLRPKPLFERRALLRGLLRSDEESRIQFSEEFGEDGDALFNSCAEHGLEGIVSKHALSPYSSGRSKTWLKIKCFTEFHLCGGRHRSRPQNRSSQGSACT